MQTSGALPQAVNFTWHEAHWEFQKQRSQGQVYLHAQLAFQAPVTLSATLGTGERVLEKAKVSESRHQIDNETL